MMCAAPQAPARGCMHTRAYASSPPSRLQVQPSSLLVARSLSLHLPFSLAVHRVHVPAVCVCACCRPTSPTRATLKRCCNAPAAAPPHIKTHDCRLRPGIKYRGARAREQSERADDKDEHVACGELLLAINNGSISIRTLLFSVSRVRPYRCKCNLKPSRKT